MRKIKHCESGLAFVEVALLAPIFALVLIYGFTLAMAIHAGQEISQALSTGARYAMENPGSLADIQDVIQRSSSGAQLRVSTPVESCLCNSQAVACNTTCGANPVERYIAMHAERDFDLLFSLPGLPDPLTIAKDMEVRVQ